MDKSAFARLRDSDAGRSLKPSKRAESFCDRPSNDLLLLGFPTVERSRLLSAPVWRPGVQKASAPSKPDPLKDRRQWSGDWPEPTGRPSKERVLDFGPDRSARDGRRQRAKKVIGTAEPAAAREKGFGPERSELHGKAVPDAGASAGDTNHGNAFG